MGVFVLVCFRRGFGEVEREGPLIEEPQICFSMRQVVELLE